MPNTHWRDLSNLILVAGHAVYVGDDFTAPAADSNWYLQPFQIGEPPFYIEHINWGVSLAAEDPSALLVFSGGQTRPEAGPRSEGQSYWLIANHFDWWWDTNVKLRATTEESAKDSFQNVLFGICRFHECVGRYPQTVTVVSWRFKMERFDLHRDAIKFPRDAFAFKGVNDPIDLEAARKGEKSAVDAFAVDPYGTKTEGPEDLGTKRIDRNPFNRPDPYSTTCPHVVGLLAHRGPDRYNEPLPWT